MKSGLQKIHEELIQQKTIGMSIKFIFEYDNGSCEEMHGKINDGIFFKRYMDGLRNYFDINFTYDDLIVPLPFVRIFIGIRNVKTNDITWFDQGKYKIDSKYGYTYVDVSQLKLIGKGCDCDINEEHRKLVLDNDFINSILIDESKDLSCYPVKDKAGMFYITTKLCPFANQCKEIMYKRTDSNKICTYSVESYLHDLKNGTTKWGVKITD